MHKYHPAKIFCFLLLVVVAGCSPKAERQEYITIGVLLPLTGEDSDEGLRALNGLQQQQPFFRIFAEHGQYSVIKRHSAAGQGNAPLHVYAGNIWQQ